MALGFGVIKIGDRKIIGHGGGFPGHTTNTWIDPKDHLAVVVLTNETGGWARLIGGSILKILDRALSPAKEDVEHEIDLDRFAGRFVNLWGVFDIIRFGNTLCAMAPSVDDPVTGAEELKVVDADTLLISKSSGLGSPNETVRYIRDDAGTILEIVSGGASAYPVDVFRERMKNGIVRLS
jgi:D-alanyl-D-alanine carboxypeptidase